MKKRWSIFLGIILLLLVVGCASKDKKENEMYVYYLNAEGNTLLQEIYPTMDVEGTFRKLNEHLGVNKQVKISKHKLAGSHLDLYFNDDYYNMSRNTEVLLRAAIVKTMVQVEGVEFVSFYVDGQPLKDYDGNDVGKMQGEDFIQKTGTSTDNYQTADLVLYFSDKTGTELREVKKSGVRYGANTAIERLVIEQLMKGTSASGKQSTIPKTAMILGVSVKDEVCYVNFDSKFSTDSYDLDPEVTIYSIVNSVIANSTVTKVQILLDGASDVTYKNKVDLSRPLTANLDLIKE